MRAKEKAEQLLNEFYIYQPTLSKNECVLFATICANEVLKNIDIFSKQYRFWQQVQIELIIYKTTLNNKGTQ